MEDIIKILEWRYAVKKFDPHKRVGEDKILKLKEAFNLTATSYGLQPIKMVIISNKELQKKLVAYSFDQQQVAQASHLLILCTKTTIDQDYIINYFERIQKVRGTSTFILDPYKQAMLEEFSNKDVKEIQQWSANQAHLAMGNLLTVCAIEKIDSCPMEGFVATGYDDLLGLEKLGLTSVLVMPVGYRAEDDIFSGFKKVRRDLNDSVIEIK